MTRIIQSVTTPWRRNHNHSIIIRGATATTLEVKTSTPECDDATLRGGAILRKAAWNVYGHWTATQDFGLALRGRAEFGARQSVQTSPTYTHKVCVILGFKSGKSLAVCTYWRLGCENRRSVSDER